VKCPKCEYLGFDTGDRCRNCGYDFSLIGAPAAPEMDLPLRELNTVAGAPVGELALLPAVSASDAIESPPGPRLVEPALPLFNPDSDDDTPLIRLPAHPRPPLAVRRTPDMTARRQGDGRQGLRAVPRASRRSAVHASAKSHPEPVLTFAEEDSTERVPPLAAPPASPVSRADEHTVSARAGEPTRPARRVLAAAIDHVILLGVDASVVYFTLRLAEVADWRVLPVAPMVVFLGLVKAAYFCVFTLVGGQTIGKMAARIRVVAEDGGGLDPARAIQRTLAGVLSVVTLGAAFLPALVSPDRRALHDRVARTRVVGI
jgi:uncharacterized RDD family membrane protein YckC